MTKNIILLSVLIIVSCGEKKDLSKAYDIQFNVRYGTRFYSIFANEDGMAVAIKGKGSYHTDPFKIDVSDTSQIFRIDSIKLFLKAIDTFKTKPVVGKEKPHSPRVEIFNHQTKIYDAYNWNENFWDLFRPIMKQIPSGFNQFLASDNPWQ